MHLFETLIRRTCLILFSSLIVFLAVHSLFFTAEMKSNETVDYLADSMWVHLLVIGALILLALYLKRRGWRLSEKAEKRFIWLLALLVAVSSTLCVLLSKSLPIFDQQLCISAANALAVVAAAVMLSAPLSAPRAVSALMLRVPPLSIVPPL